MFPLEMVVFPGEALNLHIFEPRYRELINDCRDKEIQFGIPFYRSEHPMKYGTVVELKEVEKEYDDGRMDIKTTGLYPFEMVRFVKSHPGKSYPGGYIKSMYWENETDPLLQSEIKEKLEELYDFMNIKKIPKALKGDFKTFAIAHKVGFTKEQEYQLLQMTTEFERQRFLITHLDKMIPMIKQAEEMRKKVQMNGHFKSVNPPKF